MSRRIQKSPQSKGWWNFQDESGKASFCGEFSAQGLGALSRLYYPLPSRAGVLSWASPSLQGGLIAGQNEFFSTPFTAEDIPHSMVHRNFWLVEKSRTPFSLSGTSPEGLKAHLDRERKKDNAAFSGGPGWFRMVRTDARGRFRITATLWCPDDRPEKLEVFMVEVENLSRSKLCFTPFAAIPLYARSADNVRDHRHVTALLHRMFVNDHGVTVCPTMSFDERGHEINNMQYTVQAYGVGGAAPEGVWSTQESFIGEGGNLAAPAAVWNNEQAPRLKKEQQHGREAIGGFRFKELALGPGRRARFTMVSEISDGPSEARRWSAWAKSSKQLKDSLRQTRKTWEAHSKHVDFGTPDACLNNWLCWVHLQPTLRRLYGNSFLPEFDYGRGGRGWRDLWQDCLALLLSDASSVRSMLLHNFGGIRIDGSNATIIGKDGEFVADRNNIPRTWMDHGAWPVYTTLLYVDQTGDYRFLLREREYFRDLQVNRCRTRDAGWTEDYGTNLKTRSGKIYRGTVLEHMLVQNLTAFFNVGEHNVCRLEGADWNDGLDMADHRGESVAFTSFYAWNLQRLAEVISLLEEKGISEIEIAEEIVVLLDRCGSKGRVNYQSAKAKVQRLEEYLLVVSKDVSGRKRRIETKALREDLLAKYRDCAKRIQGQEWLQDKRLSHFNGYYDDLGKRVEGRRGRNVRMMLTSQVFPVMSHIATEEQVDLVIKAVNQQLRDKQTGGIRLNTNFHSLEPHLGRAFSFFFGDKENGAVFSHMAVMYAYALYKRRRAREGRAVWHALYTMAVDSPVSKIFPCLPEYFSAEHRGLYCYLTGSASWLIYLLLTQVFGVRGADGDLVLDPQLTADDFDERGKATVTSTFADRKLAITFENTQALRPSAYRVGEVLFGGKKLPSVDADGGGIRIKRTQVRKMSEDKENRLVVRLVAR